MYTTLMGHWLTQSSRTLVLKARQAGENRAYSLSMLTRLRLDAPLARRAADRVRQARAFGLARPVLANWVPKSVPTFHKVYFSESGSTPCWGFGAHRFGRPRPVGDRPRHTANRSAARHVACICHRSTSSVGTRGNTNPHSSRVVTGPSQSRIHLCTCRCRLPNPTAVNCFTWPPSESNGLGHLIGPGDSIMEIRKGVPAPDDRDSGEPRNGLLESSELQHFPSCFFATPLLIRWQSFG